MKTVTVAKSIAYDRLYQKLENKEGEKEVFKLVRDRERRTRDLRVVRCIKDENNKALSKDAEIKERWKMYFSKILNNEMMEDFRSRKRQSSERDLYHQLCEPISKERLKRP